MQISVGTCCVISRRSFSIKGEMVARSSRTFVVTLTVPTQMVAGVAVAAAAVTMVMVLLLRHMEMKGFACCDSW